MPKKISELTEKTIEATDHLMVVAEGVTGNRKILASDFLPITESVTKTVAADGMPSGVQDFDDFDTAMSWACSQLMQGSTVKLSLKDGTHYVGIDTYNSNFGAYYVLSNGNSLFLESDSGDESLCVITFPDAVIPDYRRIITLSYSYLSITHITIDGSEGGLANASNMDFIAVTNHSNFYANEMAANNLRVVFNFTGASEGYFYQSSFDGNNNPLSIYNDSYVYLNRPAIINNTTGIACYAKCAVYSPTFSGNTTDTNIPFNVVQISGAYILDRTAPPAQAESFGTTAERPDPVMDGFNYFDTTLDKPLWWNGTEWLEGSIPITESVTKTVAADGDPAGVQDFDSFHEAMVWSCSQLVQGTTLSLLLEDGIHYAGNEDTWNSDWQCAYAVTNGSHVLIKGASSDASLCTLTCRSTFTGHQYHQLIMARSGYLLMEDITFDPQAEGNTSDFNAVKARYSGSAYIKDMIFANCNVGVSSFDNSVVTIHESTFESCSYSGLQILNDSSASLTQVTLEGNNIGVNARNGSSITLENMTYTTNTEDTNIPLNTIQPDGSFITDGTVPLIQADSVGTTAERPTARQIGHAYFDTTLGYSINWDGTNWVDSTGTTV